ncbi:MAG: hypothetical protein HW384_522 [Dehalococcoidia bacterium]|nr:hypothetical protein [Dehalococcoidia bacterium]
MGSEFTFYDYIDANGVNVIRNWLNGDGKPAKMFFTTIIGQLEASPPPGGKDSVWKHPYTWPMKGEWDGFFELRKEASGVQYRLLGQIRNRVVFLVAYGIHKDQYYNTDVTSQTARNRVNQMEDNPAKYRREHGYN